MPVAEQLIAEMDAESRATRALFERAPEEHYGWRPHEKSFTLGQLASHIAHLPKWTRITVESDALDLAEPFPPNVEAADREQLLTIFEASLADARAALQAADDAALAQPWTLRHGDKVLMQQPKAAVLRSMVLNHLVHHRGQLTVYFRLLDVMLPPVYGPTADESAGFG